MLPLPSGTVTFLLTDIEGSTRLWEDHPDEMDAAVARHDAILRTSIERHAGYVFSTAGDAFAAAFHRAHEAIAAAIDAQRALLTAGWDGLAVSVRMAIHTGEASERGGDYFGPVVNRSARLLSAGHGGQILLSRAAYEVVGRHLPAGAAVLDLGEHLLRDLDAHQELFQLTHPDLPATFPPLRTDDSVTNLPTHLSAFVGRAVELAEATSRLRRSRLVTLTGVGGGGKSRLAVEVARGLTSEFPDGVFTAGLAPVAEPSLVQRLVAQAVGVPEEPGRSLLGSIGARMRHASALIVLDNCEHLLEACADTADHLLRAIPGLRILATSRERLGVPGEVVYAVPPMSVPGVGDSHLPTAVMEHDAVRLFAARAELVEEGFSITAETCADVARICRAVDGIPLAIELAAGSLRSLTLAQIASVLSRRLDVSRDLIRTGELRHRTMLATLDWSHDHLVEAEQQLVRRLSVFRGGFGLDDVVAVCPVTGADTVEVVIGLVDKSLVDRDHSTGRYRMLEPVRVYAWDKLVAAGEDDETALRHAMNCVTVVRAVAERLSGGHQGDWLDRLEQEHDNIRAALRWSLQRDRGDLALEISAAAWAFWKLRGHLTEGRSWLEQSLATARDPSPAVLAEALRGAGDLAAGQGDYAPAREYLERAFRLADELGDDTAAAACLTTLAGLPHRHGDLRRATRLFEQALVRARRGGDPSRLGHILSSLALLSEDQGLHEDAAAYVTEALAIRRETDDLYVSTDALLAQGEISTNRGDWAEARTVLVEARDLARGSGFADVDAWATAYLGRLSLAEGDPAEGERLLSAGLAMFQKLGIPVGTAWAMRNLGLAVRAQGDADRAATLLQEALRIALDQVRPDAPLVLQALAEVAADRQQWDRAAVLGSAARTARETIGLAASSVEPAWSESVIRSHLGSDELEELVARGARMSLDDAGAYALSSSL